MNKAPVLLLLILALIVNLTSCKKKTTTVNLGKISEADTAALGIVEPLPYFPVYPGSYWKYSNGSMSSTDARYQKDSYTVTISNSPDQGGNKSYPSGRYYVPVYNGQFVWGYCIHNDQAIFSSIGMPSQPLIPVVSETMAVGSGWMTSFSSHRGTTSGIMARDTTITISGVDYYPTIVVLHCIFDNNKTIPSGRSYYTKNIGLVKTETFDIWSGAVIAETHLVDYFINK